MFVSASLIFGMLRVHMQCKWCAILTAPCGEFLVARFRVYFVVSHGFAVKTAKFASASCLSRFCIRPHQHLLQLAFCLGPPTAMATAADAVELASTPDRSFLFWVSSHAHRCRALISYRNICNTRTRECHLSYCFAGDLHLFRMCCLCGYTPDPRSSSRRRRHHGV